MSAFSLRFSLVLYVPAKAIRNQGPPSFARNHMSACRVWVERTIGEVPYTMANAASVNLAASIIFGFKLALRSADPAI